MVNLEKKNWARWSLSQCVVFVLKLLSGTSSSSKNQTSSRLEVQQIPERQQKAVADQDAQPPKDSQSQADVVEVVVAARQQIPGF